MKFFAWQTVLLLLIGCHSKPKKGDNINQKMKDTMTIHYAYTILYVEDVEQSMHFYKRALGFEHKFITPEKDYGELITGATTIAFANLTLASSNFSSAYKVSRKNDPPFGIELAFTTDDVEGLMNKAVSAGAEVFEKAKTKPWGQTVGYLRDINGFLIEVCTPMNSE